MWKMAWRNLWRNRTRSIILCTAIAFSYAVMLVFIGIGDDLHSRMKEAAVRTAGGSILVHGKGYWEARSNSIILANPDAVQNQIRSLDEIRGVIPRIYVHGLLHSPKGNRPVRLSGVDPERRTTVRDFSKHLVKGRYLSGNDDRPLVLGSGLVDKLQLDLGDRVVMTATGPEGDLQRGLFYLSGILETGSKNLNDSLAITTLRTARNVLGLKQGVTQLGVLIDRNSKTKKVAGKIKESLGNQAETLEILPWQEALPSVLGVIKLDNAFIYIYVLLVFVIVVISIVNTFLMAVKERVRELGLLSALGFNSKQIVRMILYETALLAVVAMSIGLVLGLLGHTIVDYVGIPLGSDMEVAGVAFEQVALYSEIRPLKWLIFSIGIFLVTLAGALYPAWRATRMAPAKAMDFYE